MSGSSAIPRVVVFSTVLTRAKQGKVYIYV